MNNKTTPFSDLLDRFCRVESEPNTSTKAPDSNTKSSDDFSAAFAKLDAKEKELKARLEEIQDEKVDLMINHTGQKAFDLSAN